MLDILSWNIRQGGGSRIPKIIKVIATSKAQIIILSEFRNNDRGILLRHQLMKMGYLFQVASASKGDINSVLIASQLPCNGILFPKSDRDFPNNVVEAEYDAFRVLGMYLPHKKKHNLFPFLLEELRASTEKAKPAVLAGDMNSGINKIDQKGTSFWYSEYFGLLAEQGYMDAFRHVHGDEREYSWYSHQGNGYRYDHTLVHESLIPLIKSCDYLHTVREEKISDHAPMVLSLG